MKNRHVMVVALLAGTMWAGPASKAQADLARAFAGSGMEASLGSEPDLSNGPDRTLYEDGTRAINDERWADAVSIFSKLAVQNGGHAEEALFWKAYAENKQGQGNQALDTCGALRKMNGGSSWVEECGALEIEIRGKSGQPVQPKPDQSDDLKLLALNALMQQDEKKAIEEIEQILNSDSSEKLKQGALFILSQHHSDTVYAQVVRVSFVEGDVRVTRGEEKKKSKQAAWEKAVADLRLESGFSLVTGEGRAEIEFEDASVLYLGENSVLTFNDLHTYRGVPYTEVALLSGTATLHFHPYVAGEQFLLHTPTDSMLTKYPQYTNLRIGSYVDGMAVTPLTAGTLRIGDTGSQLLTPGQTVYFKDGQRIMDAGPIQAPDFTAWDQWVAGRYAQFSSAKIALMKEAGLNSPIPGLAEMQGQGTFFKCEPYGTCWEPNAMPQAEAAGGTQAEAKPEAGGQIASGQGANAQVQPAAGQTGGRNIKLIGKPMPNATVPSNISALFPCFPWDIRARYGVTGYYPWQWAVCNSGSWIDYQDRYVWVAGRCHHHPPIHWVKYGKGVGFVPYHPHDIKNRPPVNGKNGVFAVNLKDGHPIAHIPVTTGHRIEVMKDTPRTFREASMPMAPAGEPRLEAYHIRDSVVARGSPVKPTGIPMSFNHHTQSFVMPTQVTHGTHTTTVMAPVSNHAGNLQAHTSGYSGGGGSHGYSGGGGGAAHSGGGGSSGGGSHGGGGGSSGGSSGGGSSAASSGGGSHH
jgi:hypothetical protein